MSKQPSPAALPWRNLIYSRSVVRFARNVRYRGEQSLCFTQGTPDEFSPSTKQNSPALYADQARESAQPECDHHVADCGFRSGHRVDCEELHRGQSRPYAYHPKPSSGKPDGSGKLNLPCPTGPPVSVQH